MNPFDIATLHGRIDDLQSKLDAETTALTTETKELRTLLTALFSRIDKLDNR